MEKRKFFLLIIIISFFLGFFMRGYFTRGNKINEQKVTIDSMQTIIFDLSIENEHYEVLYDKLRECDSVLVDSIAGQVE